MIPRFAEVIRLISGFNRSHMDRYLVSDLRFRGATFRLAWPGFSMFPDFSRKILPT